MGFLTLPFRAAIARLRWNCTMNGNNYHSVKIANQLAAEWNAEAELHEMDYRFCVDQEMYTDTDASIYFQSLDGKTGIESIVDIGKGVVHPTINVYPNDTLTGYKTEYFYSDDDAADYARSIGYELINRDVRLKPLLAQQLNRSLEL